MSERTELAAFLLRLVLGVTFVMHGFAKYQMGLENVAGFFMSLRLPGFMAYVIATIELVGGIAMILGLGTRIVAALFAATMLGALFTAKLTAGFLGAGGKPGYELEVVLLVVSIALALTGSHLYAIDSKWERGRERAR